MGESLGELGDGRVISLYWFDSKLTPLAAQSESLDSLRAAARRPASATRWRVLWRRIAANAGRNPAGDRRPLELRRRSATTRPQAGKEGVPIVVLAAGTPEGPRNVRLADIEASPVVFIRDPAEIRR